MEFLPPLVKDEMKKDKHFSHAEKPQKKYFAWRRKKIQKTSVDSCSTEKTSANPGEDVTLPFNLEPETNAELMKIKWLKSRELVYECKYGQETANTAYVNQVGLSIQELERGNISYDGKLMTAEVHLIVREAPRHERTQDPFDHANGWFLTACLVTPT